MWERRGKKRLLKKKKRNKQPLPKPKIKVCRSLGGKHTQKNNNTKKK